MISTKFKVFLGLILATGLIALWATNRWYQRLDNYTSLENYGGYLKKEFPEVEHISTDSLSVMVKSRDAGVAPLVLVDSREPEEFQVSHIPGAVNLQSAGKVAEYLGENGPASVVVYCSVGYRSATLAKELKASGIEAKNVVGSIFSWANEDRPLVDSEGNPTEKVHPYNQFWQRHLEEGKAIELEEEEGE